MSANRVEKLVYWYLRFNGYLTVENLTVHPDHKKDPEAEADILAVRFPFSIEDPDGYHFERDSQIILPNTIDFIIGEVKSGKCAINENSWGNPTRKDIEYALEWMGFLEKKEIELVAKEIYQNKIWVNDRYSVRQVCFGRYENDELKIKSPQIPQILLGCMIEFVFRRLTTDCNCLHRENWDSYIQGLVELIKQEKKPKDLLTWTLQTEK